MAAATVNIIYQTCSLCSKSVPAYMILSVTQGTNYIFMGCPDCFDQFAGKHYHSTKKATESADRTYVVAQALDRACRFLTEPVTHQEVEEFVTTTRRDILNTKIPGR